MNLEIKDLWPMNLPRVYFAITDKTGDRWPASAPLLFENAATQLKHVQRTAKMRHVKTTYELITKEEYLVMREERRNSAKNFRHAENYGART